MWHRTPSTAMPVVPIARFAVPLDENGFVDWIVDAYPGDKIAYYRGLLAHDRMPSGKVLDPRARAELHAVARRVMVLAGQGLVLPVQKRIGSEDFLYIAVKALPRRVAGPRWLSAPMPIPTDANNSNSSEPAPMALAA